MYASFKCVKRSRAVLILLVMCLCLSACGGGKQTEVAASPVDYSDPQSWAYFDEGQNKSADVFLVCPTVDMGADGNYNMSMSDSKTKENFLGALNMERGIYEDEAALYSPYYRQASFPVYSMSDDDAAQYMEIAYTDVRAAFLQYMSQSDEDRPLVLAGFSQGADMVLRLLKEFFDQPEYQDRLVAAYCIGWRITEEDISECPWLTPAEGEDDLGVIIAFSSEAPEVSESLIVPKGVKTYSINPLNWKTDSTTSDASENIGACFTDYSGTITKEVSNLTGAYIDAVRGTLKVTDINPEDYSNSLFPDGVYHLYDYQFFFRNLQKNVDLRIEKYCESN